MATTVNKNTYAGLFLVALSTLMYEILLTRIFSVTMWYHFAFVAISVAMFGMTAGAVLVYLLPNYFTKERSGYHLSLSALLFSITMIFSFLTHLSIPFTTEGLSIMLIYSIMLTYAIIAVPFVFSGICVTLALTRFPERVSRLYAADLAGAGLGTILLIYTLNITDGPTAVIVIAFFASLGAIAFSFNENLPRFKKFAVITSISLLLAASVHSIFVHNQHPLLRLTWVKGSIEFQPLFEKWNSFSRIRVTGDVNERTRPFGWGLSPTYPVEKTVKQLYMNIDASAGTRLTAFNGDYNELDHLKYDVTNLAHYIRQDAKVMVIGTGGGRDILSALVFNQKSVLGVEINGDIINTVNQRFGDFTGHLDKNPKVTFVNDEARSYIARTKDKYDIIQASLIDTWAATAAGAFVLSESSLYTVEAWKLFLQRLNPDGILTFSRWYFLESPGEVYRLTTLAAASLKQMGISNPRDHIIIVKRMLVSVEHGELPDGVGTMLVSKEPFTDKDVDIIEEVADRMQFDVVLTPRYSADPTFEQIISAEDLDEFSAGFPMNISPPTDNSPFFFHMLRLRDIFKQDLLRSGRMSFNLKAVFVLGMLLITVIVLTFLCIIIPLILTTQKGTLANSLSLFIFFAGIGFGFMFVEISQMQRLIIFLGHPVYGLSVVLFAVLLSSGLGSFLTQHISNLKIRNSEVISLMLLLLVLVLFGMLTPLAVSKFQGSTTPVRIIVATGILFSIGIFMGMPFPIGMKAASAKNTALTPWLWGINGATSVCASVVAVVIALTLGISASFWIGVVCYSVALAALINMTRN